MKSMAICLLLLASGNVLADIVDNGGGRFQCMATGSFFDFSPEGAIKNCHEQIDEFCKGKGEPPLIEKTNGIPSGYARFARAEINFQCATVANIEENKIKQARSELEIFKKMCQQDFGFSLGTPEFGNCMLEMTKQMFANKRAEQDKNAIAEATEAQLARQRESDTEKAMVNAVQSLNNSLSRPTTVTNCTSFGSNINCVSR